jgi:hypothetical protein
MTIDRAPLGDAKLTVTQALHAILKTVLLHPSSFILCFLALGVRGESRWFESEGGALLAAM